MGSVTVELYEAACFVPNVPVVYCGMTTQGLETRKKWHLSSANSGEMTPFHMALREYVMCPH